MSIKYVTPKDAAQVETLIGKAVKSVQKARVDVQIAAVAILIHAEKHGDWTKANDLVAGLGGTINGKALVTWFVQFGGLVINEAQDGFGGWSDAQYIRDNFQAAKAKMWWELSPPQPFKGFDLEAALKKVIADHEKYAKKLDELPEEDKAKVKMQVNDDTIRAVMKLCKFEGIAA